MSGGENRTYEDGRNEWSEDLGNGWSHYKDDHGNEGYEQDLGNGYVRRGDDYIKDHGDYLEHSDGTWERKWDK